MIRTGSKRNWISISNRMEKHVFEFEWISILNWISSDQGTGSTQPHLNLCVSILNEFGTIFVNDEHFFDFGTRMKKNE